MMSANTVKMKFNRLLLLLGTIYCVSCSHAHSEINHLPDKITQFTLINPHVVGITQAKQPIALGGFSGLRFLSQTPEGKLLFLTHTDRGPNTESLMKEKKIIRPFMLPDFNPRLVFLEADIARKTLKIVRQISLKNVNSKLLTGLPPSTPLQENPVDLYGKSLKFDQMGMDLEGIEIAKDGSYWLAEEYGPAIAHFSSKGQLLALFQPGTGLPDIIKKRQFNRGFEGIALQDQKIYVIMQSPLVNTDNRNKTKFLPILEFDIKKQRVIGEYLYELEERSALIGDMAFFDANRFLVIEQNKKSDQTSLKKIFLINLKNATKLQLGAGKSLKKLHCSQLKKTGTQCVSKKEILDLSELGIKEKKIEGIATVGSTHIAVIVDNDFALAGNLNLKNGKAEFKNEKTVLYLIPLKNPETLKKT